MNARTTIILEQPLLERIRETARKSRQTLRETLRTLILAGLSNMSPTKATPLHLPSLHLGKERRDIANRARLYALWDEER
ncbi:MAG: hypothetical protein HY696_02210 [Deltaproteobacteria bacterium]|nr:hypothetical protein [Deltaproteobacteria bacterium]